MGEEVTVKVVLDMTDRLSLVEKVRLIERLAPRIERGLEAVQGAPRKSLRGLWRGLDVTEEEIDEARREMWGDFPRSDTRCLMP